MSHGHPRAASGEISTGNPRLQRVIPILSPHYLPAELATAPVDWTAVFGRRAPLALEIGCGTGHFILQRAGQQPQTNFLAIDIYNKGCLKTCKKLDASDTDNVRVMRIEARTLLAAAVTAASLQAVYINCPDPWPKKRHRQRRLVNRDFLLQLRHCLQPDGEFFFSSDTRDYAEEVAEQLATIPGLVNQLPDPLVTHLDGYPLSKYMRRFLDMGQPIYFTHYRRDPAYPYNPPETSPERGFRTERRADPWPIT